ncbi:MAG: hypothetical protein MZV63_25690 [Marinilabiliales bacterium]|nr:hypothetical protein [Marinilabiliales bacterium]
MSELKGNEYIIKTIVTTDLLDSIAEKNGVECYQCPYRLQVLCRADAETWKGKKNISEAAKRASAICPVTIVRDKDAVSSCALIAETAAWARDHGKSLWELLLDIYAEYGLYREKLVNVVRKGAEGAAEIRKMMEDFRNNPPVDHRRQQGCEDQ